ncbi:hypothetical protein D3Z47_16565 [Lachnospiraceae bacterium]|nr:hypothetical protein [Lachnospiraceae bacterium]
MKQRAKKKLWKQSLGFGLSMAMALSMLPAVPAKAEETGLLKAGSLNVTDTSVTSGQPFAAGTAGSDNFRIPALIVTQDGNCWRRQMRGIRQLETAAGWIRLHRYRKTEGKPGNTASHCFSPTVTDMPGRLRRRLLTLFWCRGRTVRFIVWQT